MAWNCAVHAAARLALVILLACPASAQTYRIETLFGDFDPLEEAPLPEAWVRYPTGLAVDSEGSLFFIDADTFRIRKVDASGQVRTVAGSGLLGYSGDGGPATSARLGRGAQGLAVDGAGNVYIADTDNGRIRKIDPSGTITTIAGTGAWGPDGDGGPATRAGLTAVYGLAADAWGNLYVADTWADSIRKIDSNGNIVTVAGTGAEGHSGDGGPASEARLDKPRGVATDAAGNLYVADSDNHRIRRVDVSGTITTIAGTGGQGYRGDGGPATEAALSEPHGVSVDSAGNIYVADSGNGVVRKVGPDGTISTVAGIRPETSDSPSGPGNGLRIGFPRALAIGPSGEVYVSDSYGDTILRLDAAGTVAKFVGRGQPDLHQPGGAALDASGNVYVADRSRHRILKIDTAGVAVTAAGSGEPGNSGDGGPAVAAAFSFPSDVAVGDDGALYIADTGNSQIREVNSSGTVTTVAGTGKRGFGGDGGPATRARFDSPVAVATGPGGAIYIADSGNHRIRRIDAAGVVTTVAGNGDSGEAELGVPATDSPLDTLRDIAVDSQGRVYFTVSRSNRVFRIDLAGLLTVGAGTGEWGASGDGGLATRARLLDPAGVSVSESDTLYIADSWNHQIRKVTTDGIITTIAGSGIRGFDGDGSPATMFALYLPGGVAAVSDKTVIVVDSDNHRIRVLTAEAPRPEITSILNGASYQANIAAGSIAVVRGINLASGVASATALSRALALPTALLETSVTVRDLTKTSWARRVAGLYSVSPTEIRIQIPERTARGRVVVSVTREGSKSRRRAIHVTNSAPGLFAANGDGRGVAAAEAIRVARDGTRTTVEVFRFDAGRQRHVAVPIDLSGHSDPVYLTLFGTGFRGATGLPGVVIGGQEVAVESYGPSSGSHGVDELVIGPIPKSVRGPSLDILATVDGQDSNVVTIEVR